MNKRLRPKYLVQKAVGDKLGAYSPEGPKMLSTDPDNVDSPFVLMPRKDPAAFYALLSYAEMCEPDLALEVRAWAEEIVKVAPAYGTQGERNRLHMKLEQIRRFS